MRGVRLLPGQEISLTLAKRRSIQFSGGHQVRTPLLLPSFSSKGFPDLQKIFDVMQEHISEEILVSAYDVGEKLLKQDFDFASLLYLDSGGYESSKDLDLSDTREDNYQKRSWSLEKYQAVLADWNTTSPTVFVSYDGPETRLPYAEQIALARSLSIPKGRNAKALLLKPPTESGIRHDLKTLIPACRLMDDMPVIGVTEKEIGNGILNRMLNIARLRRALDRLYDDRPIHVFGSLDTISTYLYFLAGADIFDGLTWLRYAFHDGDTIYRHTHGLLLDLPLTTNSDIVEANSWVSNYRYTRVMLIKMSKFLADGNFEHFGRRSAIIRDAFETMNAELAGDENGR